MAIFLAACGSKNSQIAFGSNTHHNQGSVQDNQGIIKSEPLLIIPVIQIEKTAEENTPSGSNTHHMATTNTTALLVSGTIVRGKNERAFGSNTHHNQ